MRKAAGTEWRCGTVKGSTGSRSDTRTPMRKKRCRAYVLLSLCFFIVPALCASAGEFATYCNGRFGFCVDFPASLTAESEPDNGDGRCFHDSTGFRMTASGINNTADDTLISEMKSLARDFEKISYRDRGRDWFVLSGRKGSRILYRKTYIGPDAVNHLFMEYPAALKKKYDPIVAKISRSFRPGDLGHARQRGPLR